MDKDTAIKHLIEMFILDDEEYQYLFLTEQAAKDTAEALSLLTGNKWIYFPTSKPDKFGIMVQP